LTVQVFPAQVGITAPENFFTLADVYRYRLYFVASVDFVHLNCGVEARAVEFGAYGPGTGGGGTLKGSQLLVAPMPLALPAFSAHL